MFVDRLRICAYLRTNDRYALVRVSRGWRTQWWTPACLQHGSTLVGSMIYGRADPVAIRNMDPRMAWEVLYHIWCTGRWVNVRLRHTPCDAWCYDARFLMRICTHITVRLLYSSTYWHTLSMLPPDMYSGMLREILRVRVPPSRNNLYKIGYLLFHIPRDSVFLVKFILQIFYYIDQPKFQTLLHKICQANVFGQDPHIEFAINPVVPLHNFRLALNIMKQYGVWPFTVGLTLKTLQGQN